MYAPPLISSSFFADSENLQIVEGALTVFVGFIAWFTVPPFPEDNRFLSKEGTDLILRRVNDDRGDALPDAITWKKVKTHLGDWTIWAYGWMSLCSTMSFCEL